MAYSSFGRQTVFQLAISKTSLVVTPIFLADAPLVVSHSQTHLDSGSLDISELEVMTFSSHIMHVHIKSQEVMTFNFMHVRICLVN